MSRRAKPTRPLVSTADDPTLLPSEDEADDADFHLPSEDSDSESDSDDERPAKKAKGEVVSVAEPALSKADVEDLWASFNAPLDSVPSTSSGVAATSAPAPSKPAAPKTIKITVEYQFAGETLSKEKEVAADSDEARQWLAKQSSTPSQPAAPHDPLLDLFGPSDAPSTPVSSTSSVPSTSASASATSAAPSTSLPPKLPPPKRARSGGLASLSASLSSKPVKLNTLEKSKLDWNSFVSKEDLAEDLGRARKDGYLEKQDFLKRTEDKREEAWDKGRQGRR